MKELGITEDKIYDDLVMGKSDGYEKSGGKKLWMGRYQGSRKRITARERGSSSFRCDNELSKSVSFPAHVVSHVDTASSVGDTSLLRISTETESKSHEYASSNILYDLGSGDAQERASSEVSGNNNQGIEKERSASNSLSQTSHSTIESVHISGKKRQLTSRDSCIQLHSRKQHEKESDDSVFKEKGKLKKYNLKRNVDKKSRYSPPNRLSDHSDDDKPGQDQKCLPRSENASLCQSPLQSEANTSVNVATQVNEMMSQIHSMDLENFPELPIPELVKHEPIHRIDLDSDLGEPQVIAPLDAPKTEPEIQSSCPNMSCTPPISAFDFERDETPPAEIVEATAEWCRTQNLPPNFCSASLQRVFQYYQSSMVADGTNNKNENGLWHSPVWPGIFQQRDQPLGQSLAATSSDVTNPVYACSSQSEFYASLQNVDPTSSAGNIHVDASAHSKSVSTNSEQANLHVAPVLHGEVTSNFLECKQLTSHLHNTIDGDTQLSDGEIQEHLRMFLNKKEAEAREHSFDFDHIPASGTQAGVEAMSDLIGCIGSGQVSHTAGHCSQQGKKASNFDLTLPCHSRCQNIYTTPENPKKSNFMTNVKQSGMQQEGYQRVSRNLSDPNYLCTHESRGSREEFALDHLFRVSYAATMNSVEETTGSIAEGFHHKYDREKSQPSRCQWKEGEHRLSRSQQPTSKGIQRTEELGYAQTGGVLDLSLSTRGKAHSGDTCTSASMLSSQTSCVHEGEDGGSQLRQLNQPTVRESYQYHNPSHDHHKHASQVDFVSSPSEYQHADVKDFKVSSPDFHRRQHQLIAERGDMSVFTNRSVTRLKARTHMQELPKPEVNSESRVENELEKYGVSQKLLNYPKYDQPQRLRFEKLAANDTDMDGCAVEVSNKKLVLDKQNSTCTEQSLSVRSDTAEDTSEIVVADVQVLQSKKQKYVADKHKPLQKYYYKVSTCK